MKKYRNPWFNKNNQNSKEWYFINKDYSIVTDYYGFKIVRNVNSWVDVVKYESLIDEWVCVTQVETVRYAKAWVDRGAKIFKSLK